MLTIFSWQASFVLLINTPQECKSVFTATIRSNFDMWYLLQSEGEGEGDFEPRLAKGMRCITAPPNAQHTNSSLKRHCDEIPCRSQNIFPLNQLPLLLTNLAHLSMTSQTLCTLKPLQGCQHLSVLLYNVSANQQVL